VNLSKLKLSAVALVICILLGLPILAIYPNQDAEHFQSLNPIDRVRPAYYEITTTYLGTLGGSTSCPSDINDVGQVIGYSQNYLGNIRAFFWTAEGGMVELYTPVYYDASIPKGINNAGHVIYQYGVDDFCDAAYFWTPEDGELDLGYLENRRTIPMMINDADQVVGSATSSDGDITFFWTPNGGIIPIDSLGSGRNYPADLNEAGQVVGYYETLENDLRAFCWSSESGMIDIGTLAGQYCEPIAINDLGQIVGVSTTGTGEVHAFFWSAESGMIDLGTLGGISSVPAAINNLGQVAGRSTTPSGDHHAFFWTAEDGMIDLGTLGGTESYAIDMNNLGQVIGSTGTAEGTEHTFIWSSESGMIDVGTLGGANCYPAAINEQGRIIGHSITSEGLYHAFLWTIADGMIDLGDVSDIDPFGLVPNVFSINPAGQIVGCTASGAVLWTYSDVDIPPTIDSPSDMELLEGIQDQYIEWMPSDYNPESYTVTRNGEVVSSGDWLGGSILIDIDTQLVGSFTYDCTVYDTSGNSVSDAVLVEVISQAPFWIFAPSDQIISSGQHLDYQLAVTDTVAINEQGVSDWWISDTTNFELSATYYGHSSTARINTKSILAIGIYELDVLATDLEGCSVSDSFQVIVVEDGITPTAQMELKLSGSFDYLLREDIRFQLAGLLLATSTGNPVSGATITFDIYGPNGTIFLSGLLEEDTDPGVYVYTHSETMKDAKKEWPKGIYLVYACAIAPGGSEVVDMLQFHIDPPGAMNIAIPLGLASAVVFWVSVGGVLVLRKRRLTRNT
jgi:probable HAF family extracellular repeat protein